MRAFPKLCVVALLLPFLLLGCNLINKPPAITAVGWWTDNIHPAYFAPDPHGKDWDLTDDYDAATDLFGGALQSPRGERQPERNDRSDQLLQ